VCGLVGFVHLAESKDLPDENKILDGMLAEISARGPDGNGSWHNDVAHFGHCRLSIIDLSESSSQPMKLENDDWIIVYNGEIYNFESLKSTLLDVGEQFFSAGDTEVLLRGFKRFGLSWLPRLNGMFAAAIWDKEARKLSLFRDRFGIKPLYWTIVGGTVLFASQIKCFQRFPLFKSKFNLHWLNEYLTFQTTHGGTTPFQGVSILDPGHCLEFQQGSTLPKRTVWAPQRKYDPNFQLSPDHAAQVVGTLFSKAVQNTLVSDVPVGSYLSGGIDSSAIVAVASKHDPLMHNFTCGFDEHGLSSRTRSTNELKHAREFAGMLGTTFHEITLKADDISAMHATVLRTIEEPRLGVLYQNDIAARCASSSVKVCLSGAGGDELFGGYPWRYRTIRNAKTNKEFISSYYQFWQRVYKDTDKTSLFNSQVLKQIDIDQPFKTFAGQFPQDTEYSDIGVKTWLCLKYESELFLHGLLQIGDRLAGAYGFEERFPFLDNELVSFLDTIPAQYHWDPDEVPVDGQFFFGKLILRNALAKLVPENIAARQKQGFAIPIKEWFDGPLSAFIAGELSSKETRLNQFLQPNAVKKAIMSNRNGQPISGAQLWSLLSVEAILKEFFS